jgi:hypothetical protein
VFAAEWLEETQETIAQSVIHFERRQQNFSAQRLSRTRGGENAHYAWLASGRAGIDQRINQVQIGCEQEPGEIVIAQVAAEEGDEILAEGPDRHAPVFSALNNKEALKHLIGAALFRRSARARECASVREQRSCVGMKGLFAQH